MVTEINIENVFSLTWPIIDVRSPAEFAKGHIPGAINIALFDNDERAHVGTVYVQQSKEEATKLGYEYVTPKLQNFINDALSIAPNRKVIVHCWRGGMRSQAFAQHLSDNGFDEVKVILGGYKAYRNYVLDNLATPAKLNILGGYTGSGKTPILTELSKLGHQVIDLEGLANHKGSAFGGIGQQEQPTVEQFENNLNKEFQKFDTNKVIWVEDESIDIGKVQIPMPFYKQMQNSNLYFIDIPKTERAKKLVAEYGVCDKQELADSIQRISKRLGGLNVKNAIENLEIENYFEVAMIVLIYYDKLYLKAKNNSNWKKVIQIDFPTTNHIENAFIIHNL
ncbi:MAG: tRNA 2-selenouridine(34) synthase MnmH [Paludibacter sp.]|nr:tRNA 2-selenouridine(34) synthase MnmH [Paludibacter sp.]